MSLRYFSSAAQAASEAEPENEEPVERVSNAYKNQHIRYVPHKKFVFDVDTAEGRMTQIFTSDYSKLKSREKMYRMLTMVGGPSLIAASMLLPPAQALIACPAIVLPTLFAANKVHVLTHLFKNEIQTMWLLENGEQIIIRTVDGVLHKLNIMENDEYEIVNSKDGKLIFVMINAGREFYIATKNASSFDFNLIDRIVRAICVETKRSTNVFHHLLHKQVPVNLKPQVFNLHKPQVWRPNSQTAWRILNRTLYRDADVCTPEQMYWLRNHPGKESELQKELREKYNIKKSYPEELFYKTHKKTMQNFVDELNKSEEPQKLIDALYDDESHGTGRRGVLTVKKAVQLVNKKMEKKEKMRTFARKFTDENLSNSQLRSSGFMRSDMLY